jgi:hypothetical protein
MVLINEATCAKAWLKATLHLRQQIDQRDYTVILQVANPMQLPPEDRAVHDLVDSFLLERAAMRISTVINTLFPATLYVRNGRAGVFERYNDAWPKLEKHHDIRWGTYARRILNRTKPDGTTYKPLDDLMRKLSSQVKTNKPKRATYEINLVDVFLDLPIYDADEDASQIMGTPCLSHLSFKLKDDNRLMLTAFYRSHYYIERAFGNLLGLAWLQHFVATETKIQTAELVCISSMALLDTKSAKDSLKGWKTSEVNALLGQCEIAAAGSPR